MFDKLFPTVHVVSGRLAGKLTLKWYSPSSSFEIVTGNLFETTMRRCSFFSPSLPVAPVPEGMEDCCGMLGDWVCVGV